MNTGNYIHGQYLNIKGEIDGAIAEVLASAAFINGPQVARFAANLAAYLQAESSVPCASDSSALCSSESSVPCASASNVPRVIPCANGTDALQIAFMALGLEPGDEVIVPAFTYVAPAEAIALLRLVPVLVDVESKNFNIAPASLEQAYSPKTRAVVPVHLFGQCAHIEPIMEWARARGVFVVEDAAQALGARYLEGPYKGQRAGTIGDIGCTSFFPTKTLGCFGDGGALITKDVALAERIKMLTQHGQRTKYFHEVLGCNSRLDTLQAAILDVKLRYLNQFEAARRQAAQYYSCELQGVDGIILPVEEPYSTHVYHQYTLRVLNGRRDELRRHLAAAGISTQVFYPYPVHRQPAFASVARIAGSSTSVAGVFGSSTSVARIAGSSSSVAGMAGLATPPDGSSCSECGGLPVSEQLCREVLSLPLHTELSFEMQHTITQQIKTFYKIT